MKIEVKDALFGARMFYFIFEGLALLILFIYDNDFLR